MALLQTELEASKSINDALEKENSKHLKKLKKFKSSLDKSANKVETLEALVKNMQEKLQISETNLKVIFMENGFSMK